MSTFDLSFL
jgi:hypothetical protein